jgi:exopolysaccharide production protein ExoQ
MPSSLAALIVTAGICWLFYIDYKRSERISWALWIPAIYLFLIASRPLSAWLGVGTHTIDQAMDGSPVDRAAYLVLQVAALFVLLRRTALVSRLLRTSLPVLLFFGYCLISLIWSDFPLVAGKRWIKMTGDVMMVLIVLTDRRPVEAIKRFISWPGYVLFPLSILFIKYFPDLGKGYDPWTGMQYFNGASYNKNGLGAITLFYGLGFVWIFLLEWSEPKRNTLAVSISATMIGMAVWLLLISKSATSLVCFLMGITLLIAGRIRFISRRPVLILLLAIPMVVVPFAVLFLGQVSGALNMLERDSTLTGRTELWSAILPMVTNPILGAGFESFWLGDRLEKLWGIFWWAPTQAHNGYLEIYINLGWVGIGLLTALIFSAYSKAITLLRQGEVVMGLGLAYTVIILPYNYTEATLRMQNLPWLFLLVAAIGLPRLSTQVSEAGVAVASPTNRKTPLLFWGQEADEPLPQAHRVPRTASWFS